MSALHRDLIESARQADILAVAQRYGATKLRRVGRSEFVGPCPVCNGTDRFSINTRKNVWNCRGCGKGGDVIALAMHVIDATFAEAVATLTGEIRTPIGCNNSAAGPNNKKNSAQVRDDYADRQHRKAAWLWSKRQPISGTIAETYLRKARGITCALPPTLGFLPPYKPDHSPAMIAAFALPDEVEPGILAPPRAVKAIHLTLLKPDGSAKANVPKPKLIVGSPGALPIVLAPANDIGGLAITEGIEDALSVYEAAGLGAWAAGSAGRMPPLADVIPRYVEAMTIFAHDDKAGRLGAHGLAKNIAAIGGVAVFIEGLR